MSDHSPAEVFHRLATENRLLIDNDETTDVSFTRGTIAAYRDAANYMERVEASEEDDHE